MASIFARLDALAGRASDLGPLAARVKARHERGQLEMVTRGTGPDGRAVARLAPSTLKGRKGGGPPRAPRGASSRAQTESRVSARSEGARLSVSKSWPGFPVAKFLDEGTKRMPARPMGLRQEDLVDDRHDLRNYVVGGHLG